MLISIFILYQCGFYDAALVQVGKTGITFFNYCEYHFVNLVEYFNLMEYLLTLANRPIGDNLQQGMWHWDRPFARPGP